MRASQMIIRAVAAGSIVVTVACSGATAPDANPDVANVSVSVEAMTSIDDWGWSDSTGVIADVRDGHNRFMHDRSVTWQLQWPDGTEVGDTTASIRSTGPQTASIVNRQRAWFAVVASVVGNDGVVKSGKLFRTWP